METFLLLSKSSGIFWLHASEAALFAFGVLLVIGLIGEIKFPWPHPRFETFEFLVIIAVAGELLGDGGVFIFSGQLQTIADAELKAVVTDVGSTRTAAEKAADAADRATGSANKAAGAASNALALAQGARREADSFEKDIVSAKNQAADAESHLAEALRRAAEATAALDRLKSPRSLTNVPKLISTLAAFKGTEYAFSGVFGDEESINLLQSIDGVLQTAGWKRTLPHNTGGIGFFIKFSGWENPSPIQSFLGNGIHIFLDWPEDIPTSLPSDELPVQLRAAISLNMSIFPHLSPPEEQPHLVQIQIGKSKTVLISVGKKP
jgi:hypothetical protein